MSTDIIAHRGASKYAPENTMPAFQLANEMNADGIETDVHLTKDKIPVVIHDENVKRTTNGYGYVRDLTFSQLKELDAGSWFSDEFAGVKILSLEELIVWIRSTSLSLNIEMKNNKYNYKDLESVVYEMIIQYELTDRTTFSTFNPNSVKQMASMKFNVDIALLTSKKKNNLIAYAKELGANAVHINQRLLNKSIVKEAHENDMLIRVYTVNKPSSIKRAKKYLCDGIITDVPDIAKQYSGIFKSLFRKK